MYRDFIIKLGRDFELCELPEALDRWHWQWAGRVKCWGMGFETREEAHIDCLNHDWGAPANHDEPNQLTLFGSAQL